MANIVPNTDAKISVASVSLLWNDEISNNCLAVFSYNGPETPEVTKLVADTRARFQEVNGLIANILAALPE